MTRDDTLRMAREAGISDTDFDFQMVSPEDLERFADLVAAAEREERAKVCDTMSSSDFLPHQCAAAIRARGDA